MLSLESSNHLWTTIEDLAGRARVRRGAVAYVSDDSVVRFRANDLLITDASDQSVALGQTSAEVIKRAVNAGAAVYSSPGLHAKLLILDDVVVVGSQNLSASSSKGRLFEAGIVTDHPSVRTAANDLMRQLQRSASPIDNEEVKRLLRIPVVKAVQRVEGNKLPLIEALRLNSDILEDFVFCIWTDSPSCLPDSEVRRQAKKRGLELPARDRWDRFEDDTGNGLSSSYNKFFFKQEKKAIALEVDGDDHKGAIKCFVGIGCEMLIYMNHFPHKGRVIGNFKKDRWPPFRLNNADAKELCKLLNDGLAAKPQLARSLWSKEGGVLQPKDLRALLSAAEATS